MSRSLPLSCVLRMAGNTRRALYTDLVLAPTKEMDAAVVDCVQHKNVCLGRGSVGQAYLATQEFEEVMERDRWIFLRAGGTFAAYRVLGTGYTWQHVNNPVIYGDFIRFHKDDAPFVLEAARAGDYDGDFKRFQADVLDNSIRQQAGSLTYESCSNGNPWAIRRIVRPGSAVWRIAACGIAGRSIWTATIPSTHPI